MGTDVQNLNVIVVAGLSGLVGMFSEHALHKLQDVADTVFGDIPETKTTPKIAAPGETAEGPQPEKKENQ